MYASILNHMLTYLHPRRPTYSLIHSLTHTLTKADSLVYLIFPKILNEEGFIGDIRTRSHYIQETIDQYDTPL